MAIDTTTTQAPLLKQYWNQTFLKCLRENLYFYELGKMGKMPNGEGLLTHWLKISDLTASTALGEGTDPTEHTLVSADQTASLVQYGGSVLLSDLLKDTWLKGSMEQVLEHISRNAALTIDTVVRNGVLTAGGLVQYAGTAVARNSIATDGSFDMDIAEIREAVATLERVNVPKVSDEDYLALIHPDVKYDLQGDSNWVNAHIYQEKGIDTLYKGEVGKLYGVRFLQTTQCLKMTGSGSAYTGGSAGTDVFQTYVMGNEYFGVSELYKAQVIVKDPHPASDIDLYSTVGWKAAFAAKQLQQSAMIRIESGASLAT